MITHCKSLSVLVKTIKVWKHFNDFAGLSHIMNQTGIFGFPEHCWVTIIQTHTSVFSQIYFMDFSWGSNKSEEMTASDGSYLCQGTFYEGTEGYKGV